MLSTKILFMDANEKIKEILNNFGMSNIKAAEVMCISINTFKRNNNDKELRNSFTEKNYQDLVDFVLFETVKLIKETSESSEIIISEINTKITSLIHLLSVKESDIDVIEELHNVIDSMEKSDVFECYSAYHSIIQRIETETIISGDVNNQWDVTKYKTHLGKSRKKDSKWANYLAQRRYKSLVLYQF